MFFFDIDEVYLFFCGHIGWAKHARSIQKKGSVYNHHNQDKSHRTVCSLTPVGTAMGRVLRLVVGKNSDVGIDEESGRKLE